MRLDSRAKNIIKLLASESFKDGHLAIVLFYFCNRSSGKITGNSQQFIQKIAIGFDISFFKNDIPAL